MNSLIFNQLDFSATEIGSGLALAALTGTVTRLITGILLDRKVNPTIPVKLAAITFIIGDILLLNSYDFKTYLTGQIVLGMAYGMYWPSIEISVPISCNEFPTSKGFTLVRSADALGTALGTILGSIATMTGSIKNVYLIDIFFMFILFYQLNLKKGIQDTESSGNSLNKNNINKVDEKNILFSNWLKAILPILLISILGTSILSLTQSAIPLDLVRGGLGRPALEEALISRLMALQLGYLVLFQWPVGNLLSRHKTGFGLTLSISSLGIGCILLGISSLYEFGIIIILISQIPISLGIAAFLPTATESITRVSTARRRGLAMALFSQCFAISSFTAPIVSGKFIDEMGNAMALWILLGVICIAFLPMIKATDSQYG